METVTITSLASQQYQSKGPANKKREKQATQKIKKNGKKGKKERKIKA